MGHFASPNEAYCSNEHTWAALRAFPSPASVTETLSSPIHGGAIDASRTVPAQLKQHELYDTSGIVPSEPGSASLPPIMSPPLDEASAPDMNLTVGGALAPTSHAKTLSRPSPLRSSPGLRLPSFDDLGIAAPHPDRSAVEVLDRTFSQAAREAMRESFSAPHLSSPLRAAFQDLKIGDSIGGAACGRDATCCDSPGRALKVPVASYVAVLTPPAEHSEPDWRMTKATLSASMDSSATDPGAPSLTSGGASTGDEASTSTLPHRSTVDPSEESLTPLAWYEGAVDALMTNLASAPRQNASLKMISHALPSPSTAGHVFPSIISRINDSAPVSPTSPLTWINVFHAVPGRFNLADLPTSPPSTPGPAVGGDDYFTQKVFDSAVSIADYQDDLSSLPRSPRPIVPPSTIDVSIVERYIPPSSSNEFADMFNPNGPSILVDRLVELSPNNGSLVFIYPTKAGAQTFMEEYLGPIIDPILRTMVVVHGLSSDLSRTLGRMGAVDNMPDYDTLRRRVASLCERLTQRTTAAQRFSGRRPHFTLSYASREYVRPSRETWSADWWTKQEKSHIREAVKRYSQEAQTRRGNEHVVPASSTELLQEVLKGVCEKPYPSGLEPQQGIEVSVFVIRRSE